MTLVVQFIYFLLLLVAPILQKSDSTLLVKGDSSMHEWEMNLEDYTFTHQWDNQQITYLKLVCPVKELKSGKKQMDENALDALGGEKYPEIQFESNKVVYTQNNQVTAYGKLTITHVVKEVKIVAVEKKTDKGMVLQGSYEINMEEFDIEAPTAMFGMMKVDPKVSLDFSLSFKP